MRRLIGIQNKLKVLWLLAFSKKFLLLTGDSGAKIKCITTYTSKEVTRSGKAIYIN